MEEIGQFSLCKIFASCDDVIEQLLSIFMQLYPTGIHAVTNSTGISHFISLDFDLHVVVECSDLLNVVSNQLLNGPQ